MKRIALLIVFVSALAAAQSTVFYGQPIALTGDPNANQPSDYVAPVQPPTGNGTAVNNNRPSNAKADTSWQTPVWKMHDMTACNTSWAWSVSVDDLHRWSFCTDLSADTRGYLRKSVYNLWDGSLVCTVGYMQQGGPGHRNIVREPFTGTGYVVNSVLTVSTGSFPVDKSMTATDITINGVVYQIATDNGSVVLAQTGVNVGSVGSPVAFSGGWNDQDVAYGLYPPSQIARVNLRVCNAIAPSKVTSPTDPSWETWDTINGGTGYIGTNLFQNGYLCGGSSDMSDDGNSFCISDNTNSTGNAYDPRLYTLNTKNGGSWTASIPRYAWNTISALSIASGGTSGTLTTTGSPNYALGTALQIENANITGSGGAASARGLKYMTCYVSAVTDANNYSINGCPTQSGTVSETSGYVNEELRSAMVVEQANNFPTTGAGVGVTYLQGTENNTHNGGGNSLYIWNPTTAALAKLLTNDAGHITRFAYNNDIYLTQYAGKTVHTASGDQTMAGCSNSIFMWNSRTDAMTCMFPGGMDVTNAPEEYYSTSTPARRGLAHPYILISQTDDGPTTIGILPKFTYATRPASGWFELTDSTVAGACNAGGGGTQIAYCSWNAGLAAYTPANTFSIPLMTGTVTSGTTNYNFDWTNRWGWSISGSTVNGIARYITNEVLIYDLAANQGYHVIHHYTRAISPFYNANTTSFNELPHVTCSRDGVICGVDSSYGSGLDVSGYAFQVLKDSSTAVVVSPSSAAIPTLGTQQFTATPTGGTWSVASPCTGSISSLGIFTATSAAESCTVTNTQTSTGTATVTVSPLTVSPATVGVTVNSTQQFASNFPSTWTASCGSITSSGLYTAPSTNGTCTITATAVNGGSTATATATVTGQLTTIPLSLSPTSWTATTAISTLISQTFTATNVGTGSVTPTVTFTAPAPFTKSADTCNATPVAGSGTCHVTIQFNSALVGTYSATLLITDTAGGSTSIPITISIPTGTIVTVSPSTVTLPVSGTQVFSVTTSNGTGVTWAATCGTLLGTTYTAPASASTCTVTATAADGSGSTGTSTVSVITVAVNPVSVTMQESSVQQFTANVSVTWSVTSGTCTVTVGGLLTATPTVGSCVLTATATNGSATGTASISVVAPPPGSVAGKHGGGGQGKGRGH